MSSITLKHSGGNSVSIAAPSSNPASNRTITLPSTADGTMLTTTNPKVGNIIQVVQTYKKDAFSESVGAQNASSVCMSCAITPSSSSSKILIQVVAHISSSSATNLVGINLDKNGTEHTASMADTDGNRIRTASANGNERNYYVSPCIVNFIDEPATTSSITYGVRIRSSSGGTQTLKLNRTSADDNNQNNLIPCSSITIYEVAA